MLNGDVYTGEQQNGKWHGEGQYIWSVGNVHIGNWQNGNMHGCGKHISVHGSMYDGRMARGKDRAGTSVLMGADMMAVDTMT